MSFIIVDGQSLKSAKEIYIGTNNGLKPVKEAWLATSTGLKKVWPPGSTDFVSTWDTSYGDGLAQIKLPLQPTGTYNFDVYYNGTLIKSISDWQDNVVAFPDGGGVKQISIQGQIWEFGFYDGAAQYGDWEKITSIESYSPDFKITTGVGMFTLCTNLTHIGDLDLSGVTDTSYMFYICGDVQDLDGLNVSNVTNMTSMFANSQFNQDISSWDVSSVTNMNAMFQESQFNQDISQWNVGSVINMSSMFQNSQFNGDISQWNVGSVTNMNAMFFRDTQFNQDISQWDVSGVTTMSNMFRGTQFNQDISSWDVSGLVGYGMLNIFEDSGLDTANYDLILCGWSQLSVPSGIRLDAPQTKYSAAAKPCRDILTNAGWSINDGGQV